ncbi:MAG: hypothetical protein AAGC68_06645, partial [Verrucomicrobiota bacterium]
CQRCQQAKPDYRSPPYTASQLLPNCLQFKLYLSDLKRTLLARVYLVKQLLLLQKLFSMLPLKQLQLFRFTSFTLIVIRDVVTANKGVDSIQIQLSGQLQLQLGERLSLDTVR